ncbi:hypothetical protein [Halovivax asiaticus]|uniref:hypothetical protein n=1 Tax=Halovivax asiaticus TaxID=332953 RepID=UPI00145D0579|nr:hypothetical protein [Halovivax asiaticus]
MTPSDRQLHVLYLVGVALNAIGLAYAIDSGEYLFAGTFVLILAYIVFRFRLTR